MARRGFIFFAIVPSNIPLYMPSSAIPIRAVSIISITNAKSGLNPVTIEYSPNPTTGMNKSAENP